MNYLEGAANEICLNTDISVGLLIGANCAENLEPKEVISNRVKGPYVVKTILGWCVVGPIFCTSKNGDKVSCNHSCFSRRSWIIEFGKTPFLCQK